MSWFVEPRAINWRISRSRSVSVGKISFDTPGCLAAKTIPRDISQAVGNAFPKIGKINPWEWDETDDNKP